MEYEKLPGLRFSTFKNYLINDIATHYDNKAMQIGRAFDVLIFEGEEEFNKKFTIVNCADRRSKQFLACEDREKLTIYEKEDILRWRDGFWQNKLAVEILQGAEYQRSFTHTLIEGVDIKGKADIYKENEVLADLKTTSSIDSFEWDMFKYFYDCQLAWYNWGLPAKEFYLIAQYKGVKIPSSPRNTVVFEISFEQIEISQEFLLTKINEFVYEQSFGYTPQIRQLKVRKRF